MTRKIVEKKPVDYLAQGNLETSFYVVCNDKMILENINRLMNGRGYMGVSDMSGRMHYMIDARKNVYSAVHHILQEVTEGVQLPAVSNEQANEQIKLLFHSYNIAIKLIGGRLIRDILFLSIKSPNILNNISKSVYPIIGKRSGLSIARVERDIRYTLKKSSLGGMGYKNVSAIRFLHDQLMEMIMQMSVSDRSNHIRA